MVKRTPLYPLHRALGARMTEFGGFEMPLSYKGIIEEHRAVRRAAGIFDLSHMGEFELRGDAALTVLEHTLTNSAKLLADGQAQYTLLCAEDGGTLDDLILYRLERDRYLLCVNAGNISADREWLLPHCRRLGAEFRDLSDDIGLVAVQGPRAATILSRVSPMRLSEIPRFHAQTGQIAGYSCLAARTGYTGEDGFEIFVTARYTTAIFDALLQAGADGGLLPCGLGARDTLRIEAGLPLYGHELSREITPLEAGLGAFVKFGRGFIGEPALTAQKEQGVSRRLIGIRTDDGRTIARQGYRLFQHGSQVGVVTSGTFAPSFNRPLAIGLVQTRADTKSGAPISVQVRQRLAPATIVPLPFYRRLPRQ
jgi:aminomethyltransferase